MKKVVAFGYKKADLLFMIILLTQVGVVQATWNLVKVDNQSDLILLQAVRNNDVEIPSISQLLKNPTNHLSSLDGNVLFGSSGGCKIIAKIPQGSQVVLAFYGDPTHRVANGRARYADLDSRNAAAIIKESMMARVFMVQGDTYRLIGFVGYEEMNQKLSLTLQGFHGSYVAVLTKQK